MLVNFKTDMYATKIICLDLIYFYVDYWNLVYTYYNTVLHICQLENIKDPLPVSLS